jgi:hypothetical protein
MSIPSFLDVSFYHIHRSEFLVLTQNIPGMTVSDNEGCESQLMFLECTVAVTCPLWTSASI